MHKKKILVLGDCQSSGNNCLAHEIMGVENYFLEWSLNHNKKTTEVIRWALQQWKKQEAREKISVNDIESKAWQFLRQEELKLAWPNLLVDYDVVNLSRNGAHFLGYHKRLLQEVTRLSKIDCVLITDYVFSHTVVSFKLHDRTHVYEKTYDYNIEQWNPTLYDKSVHDRIIELLQKQTKKPMSWFQRRHRHAYYFLRKSILQHNIPWFVVRFGERSTVNVDFFDSFMEPGIDCRDLYKAYRPHDRYGEWSKSKLDTQPLVADRIQQYLDSFFQVKKTA